MAQTNCQKIKLLKLYELLRQQTDEQHPLSTTEIIAYLEEMGISCDRRTLAKDIKLLDEQGFEVMKTWVKKKRGYYVEDRSFSVPELKILIDTVQAANFITPKKTTELIERIADLGGSHRAEVIKGNIVGFNTRKHSNESIYYNIDTIEEALKFHQAIRFRYYDLDHEHKKAYRHGGDYYEVEPIALILNEDNYYITSRCKDHEGNVNYRVDRMDSVEVVDRTVSEEVLREKENVARYTEQTVKMFGGHIESVTLEFERRFIGAVYDRFGEDTEIVPSCKPFGEDKYTTTVSVQISPPFFGWVFQFGKGLEILAPETVVDEYRQKARGILEKK